MRVYLVVAILSVSAAAAAADPPKHKIKVTETVQPAPIDGDAAEAALHERENAAAGDLVRAIMDGNPRDVAARFDAPLDYADVDFPRDAACGSRFHDHGYLKKRADVASFAACLTGAQDAFRPGTMFVRLSANGKINRIWVEAPRGDDDGEPNGEDDGVVGGVMGGVVGGVDTGPPAPPPPPNPPQIVAPSVLNANRISGQTAIVPDAATIAAMKKAGRTKLVASTKICIDKAGAVSAVSMTKSSGFPEYDQKIVAAMRTWKYKPYMVNGAPTAACTAILFIYAQH